MYFQNKISGKPLRKSLFKRTISASRARSGKTESQDSELRLNEWYLERSWQRILFFLLCEESHCVFEWGIVKCFFFLFSVKGTWSRELSSENQPTFWSSTPLALTRQSTAARWPPSTIRGTLMRYLSVSQWEVRRADTGFRYPPLMVAPHLDLLYCLLTDKEKITLHLIKSKM